MQAYTDGLAPDQDLLVSTHMVVLVEQQGVQVAAVLREASPGVLTSSRRSMERSDHRRIPPLSTLPSSTDLSATVVQLGTRYSTLRIELDGANNDAAVRFAVGRLEASVGTIMVSGGTLGGEAGLVDRSPASSVSGPVYEDRAGPVGGLDQLSGLIRDRVANEGSVDFLLPMPRGALSF